MYLMEEKINLLYNFLYNNSFNNCFDINKIQLGKITIDDIKITDKEYELNKKYELPLYVINNSYFLTFKNPMNSSKDCQFKYFL
jgi:hypothetical protein